MAAEQFEGQEELGASPAEVFAQLTTPDRLAALIPDLVSHQVESDRKILCTVRPGVAFLRGTMNLQIEFTELSPPSRAVMEVIAKGIGSSMKLQSHVELHAHEKGTLVKWRASLLERKGLVSAVSGALIRAAAENVVKDAWKRVRAALGE